MKNLVISCGILGLYGLSLSGCMTIQEQKTMREDIERMQLQVLELQRGSSSDKTSGGSGGASKNLATASATLDRLNQQQSKMAGDIDLLRRAIERSEMPGAESQKDSIFSKMADLESRMKSLESAQKEMIVLLEKQTAGKSDEKKALNDQNNGDSSKTGKDTKLAKDRDSKERDPVDNEAKSSKDRKVSKETSDSPEDPKLVVDPRDSGSKAIKEVRVLFTKNKWKQIIEMSPSLLESIEKKSEREELLSIHAESLFKSGDIKEAAIKYNEFLDMKPAKKYVPQATMRMGDCYRHLGDNDTALIYYEELAKSFPSSPQGQKARERISQLSGKKKTKRG